MLTVGLLFGLTLATLTTGKIYGILSTETNTFALYSFTNTGNYTFLRNLTYMNQPNITLSHYPSTTAIYHKNALLVYLPTGASDHYYFFLMDLEGNLLFSWDLPFQGSTVYYDVGTKQTFLLANTPRTVLYEMDLESGKLVSVVEINQVSYYTAPYIQKNHTAIIYAYSSEPWKVVLLDTQAKKVVSNSTLMRDLYSLVWIDELGVMLGFGTSVNYSWLFSVDVWSGVSSIVKDLYYVNANFMMIYDLEVKMMFGVGSEQASGSWYWVKYSPFDKILESTFYQDLNIRSLVYVP